MPSTWIDEAPMESSDPMGGEYGEGDVGVIGGEFGEADSDLDDAEASLSTRQARARRMALARSRAARPRAAQTPPRTVSAAVQQTQVQVREVDLANKVQSDTFGSAMRYQSTRIDRAELAFVASLVERQLESSFPRVAENRLIATGLRGAPLLLLKPARRGRSFSGYARNPQVLGVALVAGLTIASDLTRQHHEVSEVRITRAERDLDVNNTITFRADAFDRGGHVIADKRNSITWTSADPKVA